MPLRPAKSRNTVQKYSFEEAEMAEKNHGAIYWRFLESGGISWIVNSR
jgi:hypothetical protein